MKRLTALLFCAFLISPLMAEEAKTTDAPTPASHTYEIQVLQNKDHRVLETKTITLKVGEHVDISQTSNVGYLASSSRTKSPLSAVFKTRDGSPVPSFDKIKQQEPDIANLAVQEYGDPDGHGNLIKTDNVLGSFQVGTIVTLTQAVNHKLLAGIHESKVDRTQTFSVPDDEEVDTSSATGNDNEDRDTFLDTSTVPAETSSTKSTAKTKSIKESSPTHTTQSISLPTVSASYKTTVLALSSHERKSLRLSEVTIKITAKD